MSVTWSQVEDLASVAQIVLRHRAKDSSTLRPGVGDIARAVAECHKMIWGNSEISRENAAILECAKRMIPEAFK